MRWLERLIEILEEEIALIKGMRELLAKEREAVIDNDVDALLKLAKQKETLAMKHRLLEEARISCLRKAGREGYTLSQLREELAPSYKKLLDPVVSRLQDEVERLMWENKRNALLINKAMQINSELIKLFSPFYSLSYNRDGTLSSNFDSGGLQLRG